MKSGGKNPVGKLENHTNAALEAMEYTEDLSKVCRERFGKDCAPGQDFGKVDEAGESYCADVYEAKPGNGIQPNTVYLDKPLGKVCIPAKKIDDFPASVKRSVFAPAPAWAREGLDTSNLDNAERQVAGDFAELEAETAKSEIPAEAQQFLAAAQGDNAVALRMFEKTKAEVENLKKQLGEKKVASLEDNVQKLIDKTGGKFPELTIRKKVYQDYLNGK